MTYIGLLHLKWTHPLPKIEKISSADGVWIADRQISHIVQVGYKDNITFIFHHTTMRRRYFREKDDKLFCSYLSSVLYLEEKKSKIWPLTYIQMHYLLLIVQYLLYLRGNLISIFSISGINTDDLPIPKVQTHLIGEHFKCRCSKPRNSIKEILPWKEAVNVTSWHMTGKLGSGLQLACNLVCM